MRLFLVEVANVNKDTGERCACRNGGEAGGTTGMGPLGEITGYDPDTCEGTEVTFCCIFGKGPVCVTGYNTGVIDGIPGDDGEEGLPLLATIGVKGADCEDNG